MKNDINEWPFGAIFVCGDYIMNKSALVANTFVLSFLSLIRCFSNNQPLYTPQKSIQHGAFSMSNSSWAEFKFNVGCMYQTRRKLYAYG